MTYNVATSSFMTGLFVMPLVSPVTTFCCSNLQITSC